MRRAQCFCGSLSLEAEGEPLRVSACHCFNCQRSTGSAFALVARFAEDKVRVSGPSTEYARKGDSGSTATFHFCPTCGTALYWTADALPGFVAVAVGGFNDPDFPEPVRSVYDERKLKWLELPAHIVRE